MERKIPWRRLLMRRGVLVQDRDGRVRRMLIEGQTGLLERLQAAIFGISVVEQLPV